MLLGEYQDYLAPEDDRELFLYFPDLPLGVCIDLFSTFVTLTLGELNIVFCSFARLIVFYVLRPCGELDDIDFISVKNLNCSPFK